MEFSKIISDFREQYNISFPISIQNIEENFKNLFVFKLPVENKEFAATALSGKNNLIILNSNMTIGRLNFSLCHELYHLYIQEGHSKTDYCEYVDDVEKDDSDTQEKLADEFAESLLIPDFQVEKQKDLINYNSIEGVIKLAQLARASYLATLLRLKKLKMIDFEFYERNKELSVNSYCIQHKLENSVFQADREIYYSDKFMSITKTSVSKGNLNKENLDKILEYLKNDDKYPF